MTMHRSQALAAVCALALSIAAPAAAEDAIVTALDGAAYLGLAEVGVDAVPVRLDTGIPNGAAVRTDEGARLAMLAERDVLLELYGRTELAFTSQPDGPPRVDFEKGSIRAGIGSRPRSLRLQIHTPTAQVTPLGALVHLHVDPENGETRITCLEEKVVVQSLPGVSKRSVILNRGQQVTVRPGEGPGPIQKVGGQSEGGAPLVYADYGFRAAALASESRRSGSGFRERIAKIDVPLEALPPVSSDRPSGTRVGSGLALMDRMLDACDPTSCGDGVLALPEPPLAGPPTCPPGSPPSETCVF